MQLDSSALHKTRLFAAAIAGVFVTRLTDDGAGSVFNWTGGGGVGAQIE